MQEELGQGEDAVVDSGTATSKTSTTSLPTEGAGTTTPTRMGHTIRLGHTTAALGTNQAVKGATGVEEGGRTNTVVVVQIIGGEEVCFPMCGNHLCRRLQTSP